MRPTVITGLSADARCMQEEIFGEASSLFNTFVFFLNCFDSWCNHEQ